MNLIIKVIFPYLRNSQQVLHQIPVDAMSAEYRPAEQTLEKVPEYQKSVLVSLSGKKLKAYDGNLVYGLSFGKTLRESIFSI